MWQKSCNFAADMTLREILLRISPLSDGAISRMETMAEEVCLPKGTVILPSGKRNHDLYFIAEGLARAYVTHDGEERTYWIATEGEGLLSLHTYITGEPSYDTHQLLEDSRLYRIRVADLRTLFEQDLEIANWGRRLFERELAMMEPRLIDLANLTAKQRYKIIIESHPALLQRVPLEHLATYLGITPVSLSRIRGQLKDMY